MNALISSGIAKAQALTSAARRFSEAARKEVIATIIIAKEDGMLVRRGRPSLNPTPFDIKARLVLLEAHINGKFTVTSEYVVNEFIESGYVSANKGGIVAAVRMALTAVKNNNAFDTGGKYLTAKPVSDYHSHAFLTMNLETGELEIVSVFKGKLQETIDSYSKTHKIMSVRQIEKNTELDKTLTMYRSVCHYNGLARRYGFNPNYDAYSSSFNKVWDMLDKAWDIKPSLISVYE